MGIAFGSNVWPNTNLTNSIYGGANIQATSTYFLDSSQDPWQWASVTDAPNKYDKYQMVVCSDCGHCSDLRGCPSLPGNLNLTGCTDMTDVNLARDNIVNFLTSILD